MRKSDLRKDNLVYAVLNCDSKIVAVREALCSPVESYFISLDTGVSYKLNKKSAEAALSVLNKMSFPSGVAFGKAYTTGKVGEKRKSLVVYERVEYTPSV